jgi:2-polyprenyl-6-methoxyphenol hydroxylase-like FAD-dependent oxidoreductase
VTNEETFVLIVGGGPVGLTAAIELGWRQVPAVLINENLETAQHPKCNNTNARSMEHFRRLGVAHDIRRVGLPAQSSRQNAYVTRFCGYELARMTRPYPLLQQGRMAGGSAEFQKTPEPPHTISQIRLEPILKQHAERAADVRFGWRLVSFEQGAQAVSALVEDVRSGERKTITARYLVAADGAKSLIRRELGLGMTGEDGSIERTFMGGTMLSYYIRAPRLMAQSGRAPAVITWIINREVRGFMYLQDGREHWIVHFQVPKGADWSKLEPHAVVRSMIGADTEVEILSGGPWTGGLALVAEKYQSGRIFLVGDAAHLFTPLGGFGMNTGIGDVMNLGWKIAAVHQGWAGANLLDTFDLERRPIGLRNSKLGVHCARKMSAWPVPEDVEEPGEAAAARRRAFGAFCVEDDKDQYNTTGLQLGER